MKLTTTLFLALVLSGLSVYYFTLEKPSFQSASPADHPKILNLAEGDSISYLALQNSSTGEKLVLERKGSDWMLTAPVNYPAENFLVEGMIQALAFGRRDRPFSLKGKNPGEFGFDSPKIQMTLQSQKKPGPRTLAFGGESPVAGGGVYVRWQDEEEAFLIPSPLKAAFERTVYSLRRKKLFRVRWDNVNAIYVKSGPKKYRLEKKENKWHWTIPSVPKEIPLEKVFDLIYSFQALYIKEFLDGKPPKAKEFGLDSPEILLALGEVTGAGEKLSFGARAKGKDALYAIREKENLVLLVSEKNLRSLLELFDVTLQEMQGNDSRKTSGSSGEDRKSPSPGGEEPVGGDARPRDQKRPAPADPGSLRGGGEGIRREPAPRASRKKA